MESEKNTLLDDAVTLVCMRNEFYRKKYYLALSVYLVSLVVVGVLIGMLVYLIKHPPEPFYFAADDVGRLIQEVPLSQPNMPVDDVTAWTIEAVQAANSYDFVNYRAELQEAQKYFTNNGWSRFIQGLNRSKNLDGVIKRKLIGVAKVIGSPTLVEMGLLSNGIYAYKYVMYVLVTYMRPPYDNNTNFQNPLQVTVVVGRQSVLLSYKGLGITQMITVPVTNPGQGTLSLE